MAEIRKKKSTFEEVVDLRAARISSYRASNSFNRRVHFLEARNQRRGGEFSPLAQVIGEAFCSETE